MFLVEIVVDIQLRNDALHVLESGLWFLSLKVKTIRTAEVCPVSSVFSKDPLLLIYVKIPVGNHHIRAKNTIFHLSDCVFISLKRQFRKLLNMFLQVAASKKGLKIQLTPVLC